ncbi:MAG TPA: AbiV family abortive infection protein, partial [Dehalococcoidia bacterium]
MDKYPTVTVEEVLRGAELALKNAGDLIDDAVVLLEAGRPQRAIALAVLGMEELGKIPRMLQVQRYEADGRMKAYWKHFRDHDAKSGL